MNEWMLPPGAPSLPDKSWLLATWHPAVPSPWSGLRLQYCCCPRSLCPHPPWGPLPCWLCAPTAFLDWVPGGGWALGLPGSLQTIHPHHLWVSHCWHMVPPRPGRGLLPSLLLFLLSPSVSPWAGGWGPEASCYLMDSFPPLPPSRDSILPQEEWWEERPAAPLLSVPTTNSRSSMVFLSLRMVGNTDGWFGALFLPEHIMYVFIF